ncbi:MAG TPA: hypothetical protein EYH56_00430 [Nanoarchaeota archaeon]|nr:hypothetical protein [Nanoarchaeota archaeon]
MKKLSMSCKLVLITDLEGVWIRNDKNAYIKLTNKFFLRNGINLKKVEAVDREVFPKLAKMGRVGELKYREVIEKYFEALKVRSPKKLAKEFISFEKKILKKYLKLIPFAKKVLKEIKNLGIFLVCLSDSMYSCNELRNILKELGIAKYFDIIYTSNHLKCEKPEAFKVLIKKLKLKNKKVIFIGHDNDELLGAKEFGFITIGLKNENADFIVENLKEIPKLIFMKKFCYKCGKITDDLEDGLCKECKEIITKTVELTICSKCGKIKEGKVWKNKTIENAIKDKLNAIDIDFEKNIAKTRRGEIKFEVKIKKEICIHCSRFASGYYESVLQLRNFSSQDIQRIFSLIKENFRIEENKHGIDIYLMRKPLAEKIARKIKRIFKNVEIKKSFELVTVKDGKRVYRNYISVRKHEEKRDVNT